MEHNEYFSNLDEIEKSWRELKSKNFPQNLRDSFWKLCIRGRELFWIMSNDSKRKGEPMVSKVPSYERAVTLLEFEKRYADAVRMCEEANKLGISTDWYSKRIEKLNKKF